MLVVRGVPFPIIERLQVSVPLNSRPVEKGRDHSPPKAFLRGVQHLFQFRIPGHLWLYLVYLMLTMMTHNFSFFSSLVPSSVELTLTSLACGSLAGSF